MAFHLWDRCEEACCVNHCGVQSGRNATIHCETSYAAPSGRQVVCSSSSSMRSKKMTRSSASSLLSGLQARSARSCLRTTKMNEECCATK